MHQAHAVNLSSCLIHDKTVQHEHPVNYSESVAVMLSLFAQKSTPIIDFVANFVILRNMSS